jgi:protease-4
MRLTRVMGVWGLGAACGLWAAEGRASEPLPTSAEHVATPGRSVAADDTTDAIVLNPANLAFLPGPELRWTYVGCPDNVVKVGCGHAWEAGTPLIFGLSTALRVDLVQPPWGGPLTEGVGFPYRGDDFVWVTWGLATKLGEHAAFGMSIENTFSRDQALDGIFGISAALSWRPDTHFGLAAVARDFNRPRSELLPPSSTQSTDALPILDGRYAVAVAFRPTGRKNLEIGLEAQYWEGANQVTPRATVGLDVPGLGRAYGSIEVAHLPSDERRGVLGTAGLEVRFRGLAAGGGALIGNGLGGDGTAAGYVTAAISAYSEPGIPRPSRAVWIRLETTPSTRGHVALLQRLWHLERERDIDAVVLVVRAEPASSFAHAEELADAIRGLRARGKKVLCSFEDAGPKALYACASADRIVVSPAGGVRYSGLKAQYMYLRGLLDKIGVRADFVRIGPHKSAPEEFTNEHAGPVAHDDYVDLLQQQAAVFDKNLSLYRRMSEERIQAITQKGPFIASEAREAGLVDGLAFDDELEAATRELVGRNVSYDKYEDETTAPSTFGPRARIGLLYLDGDIVDGRSQHVPLLDVRLVGSYSMVDSIRELRDDPTVRAVVLRIESPGGSSLASDVMWRELSLLAKKKPLIVSMGTVAASGGYYVASASRNIFALPLTITGSIGVFYGKADVSGLLDKIGVTIDTYKTSPRADAESMYRGFTPDEEQELQRKVGQFYDTFLDRVSVGRGMKKEDIDRVGRGRVWVGQQALDRGLVDHLGGLRDALQAARDAAHLPDDAPILESPRESQSLLELALDAVGGGSLGVEATEKSLARALPPAVLGLARALAPLVVFRGDEPLARLEWVDPGEWLSP